MSDFIRLLGFELLVLIPYGLVAVGVFVAVFAKALSRCPYQPDEEKVFTRPLLPRSFSQIYVVKLNLQSRHKLKRKA